jgi:AcrR family transcriptional regulator
VTGSRGPYAKTAARRAEILRVAREHFARNGFHAASLRAIAADVGVSHAAVLHHFPTKEELLAEILAQREEAERAYLVGLAPSTPPDRILVEGMIRGQSTPELVRLWAILSAEATNPSHPAARSITARYARVRAELADGLALLQAAGRVRPGVDPSHIAATVLAVWDGLQLQWLLDPTLDAVTAFSAFLEQYVFPPTD